MVPPNKIAVIVETLYIPAELRTYEKKFADAGFRVEFVSRMWGQRELTFYSDNVSDIAMGGEKPLERITASADADVVRGSLDQYAAVMVAANYTAVRNRYFTADDGGIRSAPAVKLIDAAMRRRDIVKSALCHGLWLLTPTPEHLAGRRVICHEVVRSDVVNAGAIIVEGAKVVVDDDLVTGYSGHEAAELADAVIAAIRRRRDSAPEKWTPPRFEIPKNCGKRRLLILLSEWGYWGEELIGPLDVFDAAGYEVDVCTPTGKRPNAIPVSMEPGFVDPPLGRPVTTQATADRVRLYDDPQTKEGARLERPLNLSELLPERPYAAAPAYVRMLESYNRRRAESLARITNTYDAMLIVGGSGPLVDLANNGRVHDLILGFVAAGKLVGSECYGVSCLAFARDWEKRASIIHGKFVTGHCLEYDYHSGTVFVKSRGQVLMDGDRVFNFGPPPYPLEHILRDATGPTGGYIGNFGKELSVVVDYPFVTGRSTPDSYLTGQKIVEVLELGLRQWGIPDRPPVIEKPR